MVGGSISGDDSTFYALSINRKGDHSSILVDNLLSAQTRLWDSIEGSAPALYTEVLSPIFYPNNTTATIGDLGAISPTGTEGDAIQLWSYGFLAQVDPRSGRAVAAGFAGGRG